METHRAGWKSNPPDRSPTPLGGCLRQTTNRGWLAIQLIGLLPILFGNKVNFNQVVSVSKLLAIVVSFSDTEQPDHKSF